MTQREFEFTIEADVFCLSCERILMEKSYYKWLNREENHCLKCFHIVGVDVDDVKISQDKNEEPDFKLKVFCRSCDNWMQPEDANYKCSQCKKSVSVKVRFE